MIVVNVFPLDSKFELLPEISLLNIITIGIASLNEVSTLSFNVIETLVTEVGILFSCNLEFILSTKLF